MTAIEQANIAKRIAACDLQPWQSNSGGKRLNSISKMPDAWHGLPKTAHRSGPMSLERPPPCVVFGRMGTTRAMRWCGERAFRAGRRRPTFPRSPSISSTLRRPTLPSPSAKAREQTDPRHSSEPAQIPNHRGARRPIQLSPRHLQRSILVVARYPVHPLSRRGLTIDTAGASPHRPSNLHRAYNTGSYRSHRHRHRSLLTGGCRKRRHPRRLGYLGHHSSQRSRRRSRSMTGVQPRGEQPELAIDCQRSHWARR